MDLLTKLYCIYSIRDDSQNIERNDEIFNISNDAYDWYVSYINKRIEALNTLKNTEFDLAHWEFLFKNSNNCDLNSNITNLQNMTEEDILEKYKTLDRYAIEWLYNINDKIICSYAVKQFSKITECQEFYNKTSDCGILIIDQNLSILFKDDPLIILNIYNDSRKNWVFEFKETDENASKFKIEIHLKNDGFFNNLEKLLYDAASSKIKN